MVHPTAEHIELYVLGGCSADPNLLQSIRTHLLECPGCKSYADYLTSFYKEVLEIWSDQKDAVPHRTGPPHEWHPLVLHSFRPYTGSYAELGISGVMAAKSTLDYSPLRFEPLASFTYEEEDILLRFVLDRSTQSVLVSLRRAFPGFAEGSLLSFPALGLNILLDANGDAALPYAEWPPGDEWRTLSILIRFPWGALPLHEEGMRWDRAPQAIDRSFGGDLIVHASYSGEVFSIRVDTNQHSMVPTLIAYSWPGRFAHTMPLLEGRAIVPLLPHDVPATFFIYR
ncbi:MAG: hypothetical protein WB699_03015 [Bacteroidota bacterium]